MRTFGRRTAVVSAAVAALSLVGAEASFGAPSTGRYLVKFGAGEGGAGKRAIKDRGGQIVLELGRHNAVAARLPDAALRGLRSNPNVELVEPDVRRYPMSETVPFGISMVQADLVTPPFPANRKVGIIDSGYSLGHEDLATTGVTGTNDSGTGNWYEDGDGHGTHVAGTISATAGNGVGVVGVVPGVSLHIVKVFGNDGRWAYSSSLVSAIDKQRAAGANVINMSLGGDYPSVVEEGAMASAEQAGVLLIAAAGNGGTPGLSYPASYASVVSVAALDQNKVRADFSQFNAAVELAAPGVAVRSTVPYENVHTLSAGDATWSGANIAGAASTGGTTGTLVDGGLCDAAGPWQEKVVLCRRGSITFHDKLVNVEAGGGVAAAIYNNAAGGFTGELGDGNSSTLPAISLSDTDGAAALTQAGNPATIVSQRSWPVSAYAAYNGTSMATPHVAGVAAAIWSCNPSWSNRQIRSALNATAEDLGTSGRDHSYGFGLVRAKAALDELLAGRSADVCRYVFTGFFAPIDNGSVLNKMKAGGAVPVKFSLRGSHGLDIFAGGSPSSQKIACDSSAPSDAVEEVMTAGSSGLSYDAATDQYSYLWKTERNWAGSCRQLTVKLANGASHTASFVFTR